MLFFAQKCLLKCLEFFGETRLAVQHNILIISILFIGRYICMHVWAVRDLFCRIRRGECLMKIIIQNLLKSARENNSLIVKQTVFDSP